MAVSDFGAPKKIIWNLTLPVQFSSPHAGKGQIPHTLGTKDSQMPGVCPGLGEGWCSSFNLIGALESLSTHVSKTQIATGSKLFSLLTCLPTTTFTLLSIFSPLEMISLIIWETPVFWHAKCSLPVAVRTSKILALKLPITLHHKQVFLPPQVLRPTKIRIENPACSCYS